MKIDFLISKMSDGGAQRVVSLIANYLNKKGHQIRIITFREGDHYHLDEGVERVMLHKKTLINSVVFNGYFSLLSFYRKKKNRPDLMNSHIDLLGYLTIPVAKLLGIKIIVSEHNNYLSSYKFAERFLWTTLYPYASAVTILTSFDLEYFSRKNKKVVIMPNPSSFEINKTAADKRDRRKEVLAIGQLNRYHHKGFDNLLDITKAVVTKHPDWKFRIVGRGDTGMKFLKEKSEELGLTHHVIFAGYRTDVKDILNDSEIFILPSRFEGLPMTLLEAMSQGTPAIAYDCISGPSDIITHGENGLLIEDQNKEAMISELCSLITNESLREKFRKNAPLSLEKFSIENVGKKWEELIVEVCDT